MFILVTLQTCLVFPQAPNSSESPGTSRTEHSDLLEEEEDERSDIKVKLKLLLKTHCKTATVLISCITHNTKLCKVHNESFFLSHRIPPTATTTSVVMKTGIFAAVDSPNMFPTLGRSTLHRSCLPPALCTGSMAPSLVYMTSLTDTQPPQRAEPHTNSSKLLSNSPPSRPAFILPIPFTVAPPTYLPPTAAPSPATLSLLPMRRWIHMTNRIRPARCPALLASLMPPHKCPPSSLTMAGPHNVCRRMFDWTKQFLQAYRSSE